MSRRPWVWVQPGCWGPWGLPGAIPAQLCLLSRVHVQSGRRPVTLHRTWQSCCSDCSHPVTPGRGARSCWSSAGGSGKRLGWMAPPANTNDDACTFDAETDCFVGRVWAQTGSERLSFLIPVGNLEQLYINIFICTARCQVKVIFPYATSWLDVNGKFCPSTCQQWKTFKMYK